MSEWQRSYIHTRRQPVIPHFGHCQGMLQHLLCRIGKFIVGKVMSGEIPVTDFTLHQKLPLIGNIQPDTIGQQGNLNECQCSVTHRSWNSSIISSGLQIDFISFETLNRLSACSDCHPGGGKQHTSLLSGRHMVVHRQRRPTSASSFS